MDKQMDALCTLVFSTSIQKLRKRWFTGYRQWSRKVPRRKRATTCPSDLEWDNPNDSHGINPALLVSAIVTVIILWQWSRSILLLTLTSLKENWFSKCSTATLLVIRSLSRTLSGWTTISWTSTATIKVKVLFQTFQSFQNLMSHQRHQKHQ